MRKNIARVYGLQPLTTSATDPWQILFQAGQNDRSAEVNDLVPFWVYPVADGAYIERHVPFLPLSRDQAQLDALRRSLVIYRMVFGQARQEDLVSYLLRHEDRMDVVAVARELWVNLEPPRANEHGHRRDTTGTDSDRD